MTNENQEQGSTTGGAEEPGFEDAFRQLAEIAERLEAGGLTLSEATARYEQGMKLVQRCNHLLDSAELEITTLRDSYQRSADAASAAGVDGTPYYEEPPYDDAGGEEDELPLLGVSSFIPALHPANDNDSMETMTWSYSFQCSGLLTVKSRP